VGWPPSVALTGADQPQEFFRVEYDLNLAIATYPKPHIALIDGICMGGGIGISVHSPYRVATDHAAFASGLSRHGVPENPRSGRCLGIGRAPG
jgi:enoyl-CoA hydratase